MQKATLLLMFVAVLVSPRADSSMVKNTKESLAATFGSVIEGFCRDASTLEYLGVNYEACKVYIRRTSKNCSESMSVIFPKFTTIEHAMEEHKKVSLYFFFYINCVKLSVIESMEGVKLKTKNKPR